MILVKGDTFCINESFGAAKWKFSKAKAKFWLCLNSDNSYLSVNGKEIYKFEVSSKNNNFPTQFCLGSIPNEFDSLASREVSLKGNVYGFSVDYEAIEKPNILNIHKYLMIKNKKQNVWNH